MNINFGLHSQRRKGNFKLMRYQPHIRCNIAYTPWPLATSYPINLGNIILFAETWISVTLLWETTSLVFPFVRPVIPLSAEHGHGPSRSL